ASLLLATPDVDAAFAEIERHDVEIVQEPTDQPYGVRDCALRDPAGNLIRLQQRP
ncbi:MAG: VOC family protein, partial [Demequina sp.]